MNKTVIALLFLVMTQTSLFANSVPRISCNIKVITTTKVEAKSRYSSRAQSRKTYRTTINEQYFDGIELTPNKTISFGLYDRMNIKLEVVDQLLRSGSIIITSKNKTIKQKVELESSFIPERFYDINGEIKTTTKASNNPKLFGPQPAKEITQKFIGLCELL